MLSRLKQFCANATLSVVTRDGRAMAISQGHACVMAGATPEAGLRLAMRPVCVTLQPGERWTGTLAHRAEIQRERT